MTPIKVFIISRDRPLYLWACLDSLYRLTRSQACFVLVDSASTDPLVQDVVAGFVRRGLLDDVVWLERNDSHATRNLIAARCTPDDRFIAFIEADVVVQPGPFGCWLAHLRLRIEADPTLAIVGSLVDQDDFVSIEQARRSCPERDDAALHAIIRSADPERADHAPADPGETLISPHNPAGRLMLMRTEALLRAGGASDHDLHMRLRELGYHTAISTEVRHRHLSLLNVFDYPAYDMASRDRYMYTHTYKAQAAALAGSGRPGVAVTQDADLHLLADGSRIEAERDGDVYRFIVPAGREHIVLACRRGYATGSADLRPLGVAISSLLLDGRQALAGPALDQGWYPMEEGARWTSGRAGLPVCTTIELLVVRTVDYVLDAAP